MNAAAELLPGDGGVMMPAVKVAGVLVLVYVNDLGQLTISADFDEADPQLGDPVPVVVRMSGVRVWRSPGTPVSEGIG